MFFYQLESLKLFLTFDFTNINLLLFFFGLYGILINRRNIIIILLFFEIILLACSLNFLSFSSILDNAIGQIFSLYILTVAGSEVSLGLAFVILLFRIKGVLNLGFFLSLKG